MKTIEQRAEEYVPNTITAHIFKSSPLKGLIVRILRDAYIAGAKEQEAIDDAGLYKLKERWEKEAQINHDRDIKSIKERAKLASEDYACDDSYSAGFFTGYVEGATKQKAIDDALLLKLKSSWEEEAQINHNDESNYKQGYHDAVEKACDWLKKELQYLAMDELKDNFYKNEFKVILKSQVPDWLQDFRKAMEE